MLANTTIKAKILLVLIMACAVAIAMGAISQYARQNTADSHSRSVAVKSVISLLNRATAWQENFLRTSQDSAAQKVKDDVAQAQKALVQMGGDDEESQKLQQALEQYQNLFGQVEIQTKNMQQKIAQQDSLATDITGFVRSSIIAKIEGNKSMAIINAEDPDPNEDSVLGVSHVILENCERIQLSLSRLIIGQDLKHFKELRVAVLKEINQNLGNMKAIIPSIKDAELAASAGKLGERVNELLASIEEVAKIWQARKKLEDQLAVISASVDTVAYELEVQIQDVLESADRRITLLSLGAIGIAVVLLLMFGLIVSRSITSVLAGVIEGLVSSSSGLRTSSKQVADASRSLAEGSGDQAASLEETSASLEEMASMTKQNAESAEHARVGSGTAGQVLEKAVKVMGGLTSAMEKMLSASSETRKIVKSIDEIAFQTNLLALNAAVEAARAGEAGAGFAVVADEVRSLAMRAAEAARSTGQLIDDSMSNIQEGNKLVEQTNSAIEDLSKATSQSGALVSEIASASQEQARGITQISEAMTDMDRVTQQVSAGAEQTAAASQELEGQANELTRVVEKLMQLVGVQKHQEAVQRNLNLTKGLIE